MRTVEQKLNIKTSSMEIKNVTLRDLKHAEELFIYLNTCPGSLKPWFIFYKELFQTKFLDEIILTLSRVMKMKRDSENDFIQLLAHKLFNTITTLFSLKYGEIEALTNRRANNMSFTADVTKHSILEGILIAIKP